MSKVLVLRGPSGAGKSTFCKNQKVGGWTFTCSADHFFMEQGRYTFDATKLGEAHARCFRNFLSCLQTNYSNTLILVDNTNLSVGECAPYMLGAAAYGVEAEIINFRVDAEVAAARNVHDIPLSKIKRMIHVMDYQDKQLPKYWKVSEYKGE